MFMAATHAQKLKVETLRICCPVGLYTVRYKNFQIWVGQLDTMKESEKGLYVFWSKCLVVSLLFWGFAIFDYILVDCR